VDCGDEGGVGGVGGDEVRRKRVRYQTAYMFSRAPIHSGYPHLVRLRRYLLALVFGVAAAFYPASSHHVPVAVVAAERMVVFNVHTHKYHEPSCVWAHRCTQSCVTIPLSEAIKRGGIPCKVCGG
jgi:hypothetical protein